MIKKLIKILLNSPNVLLSKPVRAYLIQFPTVLTSVATPSRTVPVPYKTPRAVPQEISNVIKKINRNRFRKIMNSGSLIFYVSVSLLTELNFTIKYNKR